MSPIDLLCEPGIGRTSAKKRSNAMLHYVSSKGAIATMTRGLARELGADGITVNAIAAGLTMTKGIQGTTPIRRS
jgi:NAD(P)-dependent dehydrogenase (short-subunit alcohol dehydrogenase family)